MRHDGGADRLDQRLGGLEALLSKISQAVQGAGELSAGDDNEDRKRLKEKLAKALQRVRSGAKRRARAFRFCSIILRCLVVALRMGWARASGG